MGMFTYEAYHFLVNHLDSHLALLTNSFGAIPCTVPLEVDPVGRISVPTNLEKITASCSMVWTVPGLRKGSPRATVTPSYPFPAPVLLRKRRNARVYDKTLKRESLTIT
ncbi:unnamed protein product [Arctia plantaginis]|uniref:Uncharacterized protein n=1 Tax=Arctia plantaginis TaxID=874455 RepID=A0A8S0ZSB4_ARCPL|nr:unnamed protein product [Arctia plantaginis]